MSYDDYLMHHGIKGMKWGKLNGPPYPLTDLQRSSDENKLNTTSRSAIALARKGTNSRFNQAHALLDSDAGSSSSSSSKSSDNKPQYTDYTREKRMEMLKAKNPDKYNKEIKLESSTDSTSSKKSTKSTKTAEQLAAEAKAKEEKAAATARKQWLSNAKTAVNNTFNDDISTRSFKNLLDEFYNGSFSKNFKGEEDEEIKITDEDGNEVELTEGDKFYLKIMSRLDSSSKDYDEYIERFNEALHDEESTSLNRLTKFISILTDYADTLENSDRSSEDLKVYTQILGYLDNKLRWYNELGSTRTSGKRTYRAYETQQEIEEFLKKAGF